MKKRSGIFKALALFLFFLSTKKKKQPTEWKWQLTAGFRGKNIATPTWGEDEWAEWRRKKKNCGVGARQRNGVSSSLRNAPPRSETECVQPEGWAPTHLCRLTHEHPPLPSPTTTTTKDTHKWNVLKEEDCMHALWSVNLLSRLAKVPRMEPTARSEG